MIGNTDTKMISQQAKRGMTLCFVWKFTLSHLNLVYYPKILIKLPKRDPNTSAIYIQIPDEAMSIRPGVIALWV